MFYSRYLNTYVTVLYLLWLENLAAMNQIHTAVQLSIKKCVVKGVENPRHHHYLGT